MRVQQQLLHQRRLQNAQQRSRMMMGGNALGVVMGREEVVGCVEEWKKEFETHCQKMGDSVCEMREQQRKENEKSEFL